MTKLSQTAARLLEDCLEFTEDASHTIQNMSRWSKPSPLPCLPDNKYVQQSFKESYPAAWKKSASVIWGSAYSLLWHRDRKEALFETCVVVDIDGPAPEKYLCVEKYNGVGTLVRIDFDDNFEVKFPALEFSDNLLFTTSVDVFASRYDVVHTSNAPISISEVKLSWLMGIPKAETNHGIIVWTHLFDLKPVVIGPLAVADEPAMAPIADYVGHH